MLPSAVRALFSHPTALYSSHHTPAFATSLQWFRSAAIAPNVLRSRLQTTLKRRLGLPAGLVPMVISLYSMSLGIRPSFMRITWRSQRSHIWMSKDNMLGVPPVLGHRCLGHGLARWCLKSLWGSAGGRCWISALGRSRGSRSRYYKQRAEYAGLVHFTLVLMVSISFRDVLVLLPLFQLVCSVRCLGRGCWSLRKWTPPPPREFSRRWRCLGCCWLLGQGCWASWDWWWYQSRYKRVQRSWWVTVCG